MVQLKSPWQQAAQRVLLPACTTSQSAPAVRPRAVDTPRPTRRVGIAAEVLAELRAADTTLAALGMRRPVAPQPTRDLIERCAAVSTAMHADYERHLDTLHVLGEISAALTEHPEALAPPSHPGIRLTLRRAHAELAALAPVEALLNGSVTL